jgi:hypothetical protein
MGKYIIYAVMIFIVLFILNFFKFIDIPFLDVPDFTEDKQESITRSQDALNKME